MRLCEHFGSMAANNAWSNARLHNACARLSPEEFAAKRVSFFPSLQHTLNHILIVDRAYLGALIGTGWSIPAEEIPLPSAADVASAQRETDLDLIRFCRYLDDDDLDRIVTIDRGEGVVHRETASAVLSHLFVHQIHHRGQAHAMLAGTRIAPPQLDEFFLAADAPLRSGELRDLGLAG